VPVIHVPSVYALCRAIIRLTMFADNICTLNGYIRNNHIANDAAARAERQRTCEAIMAAAQAVRGDRTSAVVGCREKLMRYASSPPYRQDQPRWLCCLRTMPFLLTSRIC